MSQNWYLVHAKSGRTVCRITDKVPDLPKHECSSFIDVRREVSLAIIYQ